MWVCVDDDVVSLCDPSDIVGLLDKLECSDFMFKAPKWMGLGLFDTRSTRTVLGSNIYHPFVDHLSFLHGLNNKKKSTLILQESRHI
jgi:hypothetical protein